MQTQKVGMPVYTKMMLAESSKRPVIYKRGKEETDRQAEALYTKEYLKQNQIDLKSIKHNFGHGQVHKEATPIEVQKKAQQLNEKDKLINNILASLVDPDEDGAALFKD